MKKLLLLLPFVTLMACEKENLVENLPMHTQSFKQVGGGDHGTSDFFDLDCILYGGIDDCCPYPAWNCSRTEITVTPSEMEPVNAVGNGNAYDVVDFFTYEEWSAFFPQLLGETTVIEEILEGDYTWNKRYYGDYAWIEFVHETGDNFSLPLKIEE